MVWDRVITVGSAPVEGWGGLAYTLSAAAAAAGPGWTVRPLACVGRDRASSANSFFDALDSIPGAARVDRSGIVIVDEPNNVVTLHYVDDAERVEVLTGGVGAWAEDDLPRVLSGVDALLVNFVSGFELSQESLAHVRRLVSGPMYGDLHSLFLGLDDTGRRFPRPLPDPTRWMESFDVVQMNEAEARLVADVVGDEPAEDPVSLAMSAALDVGCDVAVVTLGGAGVRWRSGPGAPRFGGGARRVDGSVTIRAISDGDPTGCGDVWGAACFARMVAGDPMGRAADVATHMAMINVGEHTADGLCRRLVNEGER